MPTYTTTPGSGENPSLPRDAATVQRLHAHTMTRTSRDFLDRLLGGHIPEAETVEVLVACGRLLVGAARRETLARQLEAVG